MRNATLKTGLGIVAIVLALLPAQFARADAAGTSWNFDTTRVRFTFSGFGRVQQRVFGTLETHFGPNDTLTPELGDNEFIMTDGDGYDFTGTFAEGRGTRVIASFNLGDIETFLEDKLLESTTATDITVNVTRIRPTILIRGTRSIQLVWKISFTATGTYNGRTRRGVGKYEIRATGRPADE